MTYKDILIQLEAQRNRSKWDKGVNQYAVEMINSIENLDQEVPSNEQELKNALLNGASSWEEYSKDGNALIYNDDIARRMCTKTDRERACKDTDWLFVQSIALYQAFRLIAEMCY